MTWLLLTVFPCARTSRSEICRRLHCLHKILTCHPPLTLQHLTTQTFSHTVRHCRPLLTHHHHTPSLSTSPHEKPHSRQLTNRNKASTLHQPSIQFHTQTASEKQKSELTFENILSDANRRRVSERLGTVKPVRTLEMMGVRRVEKVSAVLVPLCVVGGEPSLLFTLRSSALRKHRGEVSFPGGNQDESDIDHVHTALRETFEEVGLNPRHFEVWGTLIPSPNRHKKGYMTYPVLARYTKDLHLDDLVINRDEVEEVFTCSIRQVCEGGKVKAGSTQFRTGPGYTLPVYVGAPHRIWGLSATILHQGLTLIAPGLYRHRVRHVA
ncbi:hypothetical protein ACOMHN_067063 [Nucella lapillus]